jgi:hypothetical protein
MNDPESRLTELLKAGVGDPPFPVTVQAVRHQMARRRVAGAVGAAAGIAGLVALAVAALTGALITSPVPLTGAVRPVGGPSAGQLALGKWLKIPAPPFRLCDPVPAWDGRDLVVVEPGVRAVGWCPARAAAYNPQTNSWRAIAAPSEVIGHQVGAWGGGRVVLVSTRNGKTVSWSAADGRWHQLAPVPNGGLPSITWTGRGFLVIMIRGQHARAFMLTGSRWARLPDLPQPSRGSIVEASPAVSHGVGYVLADVAHVDSNYSSGYSELLRLTASGWTRVPMSAGAPSSQLMLTPVDGGILAAGSACPGKGGCTQEVGTAALLRPGADPDVIPLNPQPGVPYPRNITAGAHAVVVTYPEGLGNISFHGGPVRGSCVIYDLTTGTWHRGPTARRSHAYLGTYWTPYGVISLGQSASGSTESNAVGGWLLRPVR